MQPLISPHHPLQKLLLTTTTHNNFFFFFFMYSSKHLRKLTPCTSYYSLHTCHSRQLLSAFPTTQKPNYLNFRIRKCGVSDDAYQKMPRPVLVEQGEIDSAESARFVILKKKLEGAGINCDNCYLGQHNRLVCPKCDGGVTKEKSFRLFISQDAATKQNVVGEAMLIKAFESGKETYSNPRKKLLKSYAIK